MCFLVWAGRHQFQGRVLGVGGVVEPWHAALDSLAGNRVQIFEG